MLKLGVNIDHVATLREARYKGVTGGAVPEPDPVWAAEIVELAGAHGITCHLREDRRHLQERDLRLLRQTCRTRIDLEMAPTPQMVRIALDVKPDVCCLVPEKRQEVTTEGGLDIVGGFKNIALVVKQLQAGGREVSLFIDPDPRQIQASARTRADFVELHTGTFCNATGAAAERELERLIRGAKLAHRLGLRVNAGHGINYQNIHRILRIPHLEELNIGHSIISRAIFAGLSQAVREMLTLMADYPRVSGATRRRK
ncbi:MAG: pyridoxine 5'-phosphate synthase [Verrucomicrobia bacterium]|nr:pyridoxine 5'-phosphate synthase [Verrucomicrobiota bacterium]